MLFNSLSFAIFFPAVVAVYFLLPPRARTLLLLLASCTFYMAFIPAYILILAVTIVVDYVAGIWLERVEGRVRTAVLVVSITTTCAVLFVFKYFNFFIASFEGLVGFIGVDVPVPLLSIILPIGLSFHTFQSLSYVIEVYYGRQKAEPDFVTYATYVMFFPQLVAGPIERPQHLLHQFWETHSFDYKRVTSGLKRMAWGFFKKLVIADRLALYVNDVYGNPSAHNGLQLTVATVFFAYQIYCDFSGYSDIAIGSARVMGFRLMENFKTPYYSRSISEFWRRWHISLSSWFRDYLYVPLGGSRVPTHRWYANLLLTFSLSGLWHGASWTFVLWGVLNGLYLVAGVATRPARDRMFELVGLRSTSWLRIVLGTGATFFLTCAAWVVFRAESLEDVWYVWTHFYRNWDFSQIATEQFLMRQMPAAVLSLLFLEAVQLLNGRINVSMKLTTLPTAVRWPVYATFALCVVLFGIFRGGQFIYFQF